MLHSSIGSQEEHGHYFAEIGEVNVQATLAVVYRVKALSYMVVFVKVEMAVQIFGIFASLDWPWRQERLLSPRDGKRTIGNKRKFMKDDLTKSRSIH